jgi:hypothetical protein
MALEGRVGIASTQNGQSSVPLVYRGGRLPARRPGRLGIVSRHPPRIFVRHCGTLPLWILGRLVLSLRGGVRVAAGWPGGRDVGGHARHGVGSRSLLCRHHGCELEVPLYPPYRFFNLDYSVPNCGGMVFSEANLKPIVRIASGSLALRTLDCKLQRLFLSHNSQQTNW